MQYTAFKCFNKTVLYKFKQYQKIEMFYNITFGLKLWTIYHKSFNMDRNKTQNCLSTPLSQLFDSFHRFNSSPSHLLDSPYIIFLCHLNISFVSVTILIELFFLFLSLCTSVSVVNTWSPNSWQSCTYKGVMWLYEALSWIGAQLSWTISFSGIQQIDI